MEEKDDAYTREFARSLRRGLRDIAEGRVADLRAAKRAVTAHARIKTSIPAKKYFAARAKKRA